MPYRRQQVTNEYSADTRLRIMGAVLILIAILFSVRLFYLQIVQGADYRLQADSGQTKSLEIIAKRGEIFAFNDEQQVPLVLNERRWLLFSDTQFVENPGEVVRGLSELNVPLTEFQKEQLYGDGRYVVLAKYLTDKEQQAIKDAGIKGLYFQEQSSRTYTENSLAAQVLGFVDQEDQGQYGIEQYFQDELTGTNGRLKAITDASGVPLAFEETNIDQQAENGQDVTLTLDIGLQQIAESAIAKGVDQTKAKSGSVVILDAKDGSVKAMANYPTFEPENYNQITDNSVFVNRAVSDLVEPGSVMKSLVTAAALDKDVVTVDSTYFDNNSVTLDGAVVKNALDYGAGERSITEILSRSLNTGSIYLLSKLGGGEVNSQARETLYEYYTEHFGLGKKTGIKLPNESAGDVFLPNDGFGLNIRYANMTFGQGLTVTPIQIASAYVPLVNGGRLYKPRIVAQVGEETVRPELVRSDAVSDQTSNEFRELMRRVGELNYASVQTPGLEISGKTGTGEIADEINGGYLGDAFTGTFAGYIKSGSDTLVMAVRIDQPQGVRFAGSGAAAPIWQDMVSQIIKTGKVN